MLKTAVVFNEIMKLYISTDRFSFWQVSSTIDLSQHRILYDIEYISLKYSKEII
jgi:hypothetical protein